MKSCLLIFNLVIIWFLLLIQLCFILFVMSDLLNFCNFDLLCLLMKFRGYERNCWLKTTFVVSFEVRLCVKTEVTLV